VRLRGNMEIKRILKDYKHTIISGIPALITDLDSAAMLYNYAVTDNPKALVAGVLIGAGALLLDWITYENYEWDKGAIEMHEDRMRSDKIMRELGLY
jgi:hypothetical protein